MLFTSSHANNQPPAREPAGVTAVAATPPAEDRGALPTAAVAVGMAATLAITAILALAGIRWGFTWVFLDSQVFTPWTAVIATAVPLALAATMRAKHFVAVAVLAAVVFIVAPAAVSIVAAGIEVWQPS
jgi:hypothetical protein